MACSFYYDKSFQHTTIYNSHDLELASKLIKTIEFENTSTTYSLTGKSSFDLEKDDDKNFLYKMFVARACDGCSTAPLTQYKTNEIYQEITEEDKLTTNGTGDRILVDMRRSKGYTDELEKINRDDSGLAVTIGFKETATKKLRLRVTGYSQGEYWYLLSNKVLLKNKVLKIILCHLKITIFRKQINLNKNNKCSYMRRRKYYKTNRRHKKRGRGFPYIYNNRVYFEKKNTKRN